MDNHQDKILSKEERDRISEAAAIAHAVVRELSPKKKKSGFDFLRHPLLLLLVGSLVSGIFIFEYEKRHAQREERIKAKSELLKEVAFITKKLLTMSENVVYLHQKPIKNEEQIVSTNKSYNQACDEFHANYIRTSSSLDVIYRDEKITQEWNDIQNDLKELNDFLELLHEFGTSVINMEHSKRIDMCVKKIEAIEQRLDKLTSLLIKNLD